MTSFPDDRVAPVGIVSTDTGGLIMTANEFAAVLVGATCDALIGRKFVELFSPTSQLFFKLQLSPLLHLNGSFAEVVLQVVAADGSMLEVLVNASRKADRAVYALFPAPARRLRDQELKEAREAAETRNRLLSQIERMASIGAWTLDDDLQTLGLSDEIFQICELSRSEAPALSAVLDCFVESDPAVILAQLRQSLQEGHPMRYEGEFKTFAGKRRRVRATAETEDLPDGRRRLVGILQDITQSFETEHQLQQLAHFDPITGLANRAQFQIKLDDLILLAKRGAEASLLLLDLDGFKEINDTFGHDVGDELLAKMGRRIRAAVGELFCARLGGDEFAVFHTADASLNLNDLEDRLLVVLHQPFSIAGTERSISVSIGVKSFVGKGITAGRIYKRADLALYQAKKQGRDRSVRFEPSFETSLQLKQQHIALIQEAAQSGELVPYLQPIVSSQTGLVVGFEALARIERPSGEVLSPAHFHMALADPLCSELVHHAVLKGVLHTLSRWMDVALPRTTVSFNLAEAVLRSPGFPLNFLNEVAAHGVSPDLIGIEIQETVFLGRDITSIKSKLQALQEVGCRIALDDFGTGFASLSHLVDFPVDCIKIDQSFVSDLEERPDKQAVIRAIIGLGNSLSLTVVAEGVETLQQVEFLTSQGCGLLQGYYFGKAMCREDATKAVWTDLRINGTTIAI